MYSRIKFIALSVLIVVVFLSCDKVNQDKTVAVYTHAITGLYNPQSYFIDNTKEGFDYAISFEGLQGIEMDVQFSQDSTLWMFHDVYLDDRTNGMGRLCERTDDYLMNVDFENENFSLSRVRDLDLTNIQGSKELFIDVKYIGSCEGFSVTSQYLIQECSELINHPSLQVSFIINDTTLASEMNSLGYSIWSDAFDFNTIELDSPFYLGWFFRNADLTEDQVGLITKSGKSVILYEMYSPGSIRSAIDKSPTGVLVEEVKEAIILSN